MFALSKTVKTLQSALAKATEERDNYVSLHAQVNSHNMALEKNLREANTRVADAETRVTGLQDANEMLADNAKQLRERLECSNKDMAEAAEMSSQVLLEVVQERDEVKAKLIQSEGELSRVQGQVAQLKSKVQAMEHDMGVMQQALAAQEDPVKAALADGEAKTMKELSEIVGRPVSWNELKEREDISVIKGSPNRYQMAPSGRL